MQCRWTAPSTASIRSRRVIPVLGDQMRIASASALAAVLIALGAVLGGGFAQAGSASLRLVKVGDFNQPVYAEDAPGAKGLLFVVEQPGTVSVVRKGRTLPRPFLDIQDLVAS